MSKRSKPKVTRVATKRQLARWQRERRFRRIIMAAVAFVIAAVVLIPALGYYREVFARGREAIAVVDRKALIMDEYVRLLSLRQYQMDSTLTYLSQQGLDQSITNQLAQQFQLQRATAPTQVVSDWVDGEVMSRAATKLGLSVSSAEIWNAMKKYFVGEPGADEQVDEVKRDADTQQRLASFLQGVGIQEDEYRRTVETNLLREKISDKLGEQIVTPTLQSRVQIILTDEEEDIGKASERIKNGEDFAQVAREVSLDGFSKNAGGELGWVPKGLQDAEFDRVVFALKPGQVSDPFQTSEGYYVVKVLERDEARDLDQTTLDQMKAGTMSRWLEEEKGKTKIEYFITSDKQTWAQDKISKMREKLIKQAQQPIR